MESAWSSDITDTTVLNGTLSGWESNMATAVKGKNCTLPPNETQTISEWSPSQNVPNESDSKCSGKENEPIDLPGHNLSSGIIKEEQDCTDGWKNPVISITLEDNSPKCTSKSDTKCTWEKSWQEDQIANVSGWNSNVETASENDCTIGWQKSHISSTSNEDNWKYTSTDKKRDWESGWKEDETSNLPGWNSNTDTVDRKDCTGWHNHGSRKENQWDVSKLNDNQSIPYKSSLHRSQNSFGSKLEKTKPFGKSFKRKYVKGNKDRDEESVPLELEDSPFPPGFSFQDSLSKKNLDKVEQTGQDNATWPSKEQEDEHKMSSIADKSGNGSKWKPTGSNLVPLGKTRMFSRTQVETNDRSTLDKEKNKDKKLSDERQPNGWSADSYTEEAQNTSWAIQETDMNSDHVQTNQKGTPCGVKDSTTSKSCYTSQTSNEDSKGNMDPKKNKMVAIIEQHSDGWSPTSEALAGRPGWEEWNSKHVSDNYPPNTSGWEVSSQRLNSPTKMLSTVIEKQQNIGWNTSSVEDSSSALNVFGQEQVDQHNSTWPSSTDKLTSPNGVIFFNGHEDEQKASFSLINESGKGLEIQRTGANLIPLGKTRSFSRISRIQREECDRNASQEHKQDQQAPEEGQANGWTTCLIIEEPDRKSRHAKSSIQDTICAGKDSTAIKNRQTQEGNGEVTIMYDHSNMENRKNNAVDTLDEQYSDGWNPSPDMAESSGWEVWHNEHVTCENGASDPFGQEFPVQNSRRFPKRPWKTKSVGSPRPSNDTEKIVQEICDNPPELQGILQEINPLMYSMRRILHFSSYESGNRLTIEDEREVLEKIFVHHPEAEAKMGCGVDFIMIDNHSKFKSTRCFYIVRKDGSREDFSYLKCLKSLIEKKFPASAKAFIEKYLPERK